MSFKNCLILVLYSTAIKCSMNVSSLARRQWLQQSMSVVVRSGWRANAEVRSPAVNWNGLHHQPISVHCRTATWLCFNADNADTLYLTRCHYARSYYHTHCPTFIILLSVFSMTLQFWSVKVLLKHPILHCTLFYRYANDICIHPHKCLPKARVSMQNLSLRTFNKTNYFKPRRVSLHTNIRGKFSLAGSFLIKTKLTITWKLEFILQLL